MSESIKYTINQEGLRLTNKEGEFIGNILYRPSQHQHYYEVDMLCRVGLPDKFYQLEAAKYYALAMYLEHGG